MITRRNLLLSTPGLLAAPRLRAQSGPPPVPVRKLNQLTLTVSDLRRSVEFYQELFGMPVQARRPGTVLLKIGAGPQFMALTERGANGKTAISSYGMSVEDFKADQVMKMLAEHGVTNARMEIRGPTAELFLSDPDGIVIQLQDTTYCGCAGVLGNQCPAAEPARSRGIMAIRDLSHFTLSSANPQRSRDFYQKVFGMTVLAYQGPTAPALGVGSTRQFVMAAGGGGNSSPGIGHGCFTMERFERETVLKALADYGIKPRGDATGPAKPLVSYVSMRMENRGGAKEGTAELYFTDPDGILLQLQDVSYCGGAGLLGEMCPGK